MFHRLFISHRSSSSSSCFKASLFNHVQQRRPRDVTPWSSRESCGARGGIKVGGARAPQRSSSVQDNDTVFSSSAAVCSRYLWILSAVTADCHSTQHRASQPLQVSPLPVWVIKTLNYTSRANARLHCAPLS